MPAKKQKRDRSALATLAGLDGLRAAVEASNIASPQRESLLALVETHRAPVADSLLFAEQMKRAIGKLPHLTEAARLLLLQELSDYGRVDPEEQRRIKERLHRALMAKPDVPEPPPEAEASFASRRIRRVNWQGGAHG